MKGRGFVAKQCEVRAILDGTLSQFVRPMKPHIYHAANYEGFVDGMYQLYDSRGGTVYRRACPYGVPGDKLFVREALCADSEDVYYLADGMSIDAILLDEYELNCAEGTTTIPSICMPRWAARIILEVVSVEARQDSNGWVWVVGVKRVT